MSQFDGRITINNTYAFTSYALRRDLEFNPGTFGTGTSDWGSATPSLLFSGRNSLILGFNPKTLQARQ